MLLTGIGKYCAVRSEIPTLLCQCIHTFQNVYVAPITHQKLSRVLVIEWWAKPGAACLQGVPSLRLNSDTSRRQADARFQLWPRLWRQCWLLTGALTANWGRVGGALGGAGTHRCSRVSGSYEGCRLGPDGKGKLFESGWEWNQATAFLKSHSVFRLENGLGEPPITEFLDCSLNLQELPWLFITPPCFVSIKNVIANEHFAFFLQ